MKGSTFPICSCYRCHKPLLTLPNSPAAYMTSWFVLESMVTCFWGYGWEILIHSPTQRTGMKEAPRTMSSLLFELGSHVQGHNSFAPQKFLAFVLTHYTGQIVPFDGPFCLHPAVPGPCTMHLPVPGKASQKGCYGMGMWNSSFWAQHAICPWPWLC